MGELCEKCGHKQKRYRSSDSSWICDYCKTETIDYHHPDAFIKVLIRNWWDSLPFDVKLKFYLENTE